MLQVGRTAVLVRNQACACTIDCSLLPRPPVDGLRQGEVELVRTLLSVTLGGGDVQGIEKTSVLLFLLGHALTSLSLVAADDKELLEAADFGSIVQLLRLVAFYILNLASSCGWPCTKTHYQQERSPSAHCRVHRSNVSVLGGAHNFLKACIALHKDRLADVLPVLLGNLTSPCSQVGENLDYWQHTLLASHAH